MGLINKTRKAAADYGHISTYQVLACSTMNGRRKPIRTVWLHALLSLHNACTIGTRRPAEWSRVRGDQCRVTSARAATPQLGCRFQTRETIIVYQPAARLPSRTVLQNGNCYLSHGPLQYYYMTGRNTVSRMNVLCMPPIMDKRTDDFSADGCWRTDAIVRGKKSSFHMLSNDDWWSKQFSFRKRRNSGAKCRWQSRPKLLRCGASAYGWI